LVLFVAEDKGIGTAVGSKIVIVFCQFLAWGQLMILSIDLSLAGQNAPSDGNTINPIMIIYYSVYIAIFVFTSFIVPFNIFLYESDE
jgi:hypothetical protein